MLVSESDLLESQVKFLHPQNIFRACQHILQSNTDVEGLKSGNIHIKISVYADDISFLQNPKPNTNFKGRNYHTGMVSLPWREVTTPVFKRLNWSSHMKHTGQKDKNMIWSLR